MTDETYLGDGLYASYDGYQIKLRAPDGSRGNRVVYLEPSVINQFFGFIASTFDLKITVEGFYEEGQTPQ